MSGYLQYSNYGEDEKPFIQQPQQSQQSQQSQQQSQHKRTLRTKTLRSKQPQQQHPQQQQPQQQPQGNQTKYSQYVIQKLHNTDNNGSDSDSDSDNDVYKQFQTEPVFSNTIYAPSSGNDLNSKLNPASAKEGFATNANANSNSNGNALAPPKQYPQYLSSVFQASSNNDADAKDLMLQKLDQIISLLENQQDEKTGHVTEELILYCFLGVFIIFIVDSFARAGKYVR